MFQISSSRLSAVARKSWLEVVRENVSAWEQQKGDIFVLAVSGFQRNMEQPTSQANWYQGKFVPHRDWSRWMIKQQNTKWTLRDKHLKKKQINNIQESIRFDPLYYPEAKKTMFSTIWLDKWYYNITLINLKSSYCEDKSI